MIKIIIKLATKEIKLKKIHQEQKTFIRQLEHIFI